MEAAARFGDEEQQRHVARAWLAERGPVQAAREVLAAAEGMSPLRRGVAVRLVDAVCVEFRGDSPVEYWSEEEPEEPAPFGIKEVNRRLAALGREPA